MPKKPSVTKLAAHFKNFMIELGLDLTDKSLKDTPIRVAKMYAEELAVSLHKEPPPIKVFENKGYDQMVVVNNISINSMCEHHFLPFVGTCHIAYFPNDVVIGLSKLPRIARHFSAKPQIQEHLTKEIADYLITKLGTEDIAVVIDAKHECCSIRGIRDSTSSTRTSYLGGRFRNVMREEFLNFINRNKC